MSINKKIFLKKGLQLQLCAVSSKAQYSINKQGEEPKSIKKQHQNEYSFSSSSSSSSLFIYCVISDWIINTTVTIIAHVINASEWCWWWYTQHYYFIIIIVVFICNIRLLIMNKVIHKYKTFHMTHGRRWL